MLGYGLVMGGAIIKFPQIIKVFSMKSVVGISFTSVVLEVFY
jgi:mannose-P-dolichol utilization defect protein 1